MGWGGVWCERIRSWTVQLTCDRRWLLVTHHRMEVGLGLHLCVVSIVCLNSDIRFHTRHVNKSLSGFAPVLEFLDGPWLVTNNLTIHDWSPSKCPLQCGALPCLEGSSLDEKGRGMLRTFKNDCISALWTRMARTSCKQVHFVYRHWLLPPPRVLDPLTKFWPRYFNQSQHMLYLPFGKSCLFLSMEEVLSGHI